MAPPITHNPMAKVCISHLIRHRVSKDAKHTPSHYEGKVAWSETEALTSDSALATSIANDL